MVTLMAQAWQPGMGYGLFVGAISVFIVWCLWENFTRMQPLRQARRKEELRYINRLHEEREK